MKEIENINQLYVYLSGLPKSEAEKVIKKYNSRKYKFFSFNKLMDRAVNDSYIDFVEFLSHCTDSFQPSSMEKWILKSSESKSFDMFKLIFNISKRETQKLNDKDNIYSRAMRLACYNAHIEKIKFLVPYFDFNAPTYPSLMESVPTYQNTNLEIIKILYPHSKKQDKFESLMAFLYNKNFGGDSAMFLIKSLKKENLLSEFKSYFAYQSSNAPYANNLKARDFLMRLESEIDKKELAKIKISPTFSVKNKKPKIM